MKSYQSKSKSINLTLLSILLFFICHTSVAQNLTLDNNLEFSYAKFENGYIVTTHAIKYSLKIPLGFSKIDPYNYQAVFNDHPFNVSIATVKSEKILIMVSAEKVTDSSGILDYSYFKPVHLSGLDFYMKDDCVKLSEEIFEGATDLRYIKENGFDFGPAIYIRHFFTNTADGTYEYVLNYGELVCDCSDKTIDDKFMEKFNNVLKKNLVLTILK